MHELSVALGIVKIAEQELRKANANKIELIELEIGTLAGIELDSLNFVWEVVVKDTVLENAQKEIIVILAEGQCVDCDSIYPLKNIYDSCPKCQSSFKIILKGKELRVKSLIVE